MFFCFFQELCIKSANQLCILTCKKKIFCLCNCIDFMAELLYYLDIICVYIHNIVCVCALFNALIMSWGWAEGKRSINHPITDTPYFALRYFPSPFRSPAQRFPLFLLSLFDWLDIFDPALLQSQVAAHTHKAEWNLLVCDVCLMKYMIELSVPVF